MCEPTTMALMSAAASAAQYMQQKAAANAANRAQSEQLAATTQSAKDTAHTVMGQEAARLMQSIEAANQKEGELADQAAEYIAATTSAKNTVSGNALIALIQEGAAKKGKATAAIARQKEFATMGYYQAGGIAGIKAANRIRAAWKPPVEKPSIVGLMINMGLSAMSAYNSAKALQLAETNIVGAAITPTTPTPLTTIGGGDYSYQYWDGMVGQSWEYNPDMGAW